MKRIMLPTTLDIIRSGLKSDPSISPGERTRLLAALRQPSPTPPPTGEAATRPRMVRRGEAALRLGVSLRTVDKLAKAGFLPRRVLPGRVRAAGFCEADLGALIAGSLP